MRRLRIAASLSLVAALAVGCVPKVTSSRTAPVYALSTFRGPDGMPVAPDGTRAGVSLAGWWRVVAAERIDGTENADHLFEPDVYMRVATTTVDNVQGVAAARILPVQPEWSVNRSDSNGVSLGFGFERESQALRFLHYGFAMRAVDSDRALATEALHFAETTNGTPVWGIWQIELRRVVISGPESLPETGSPLRMPWLR